MRRVSMATRDELVGVTAERYVRGGRVEKARILDEFVAVTGFHRKHAMRLLRGGQPGQRSGPRPGRRVYDEAVREALIIVWEGSDRICGKRLRPLLPVLVDAMERHGHLQLAAELRADLLAMSAATIDRALQEVRGQAKGRPRRRAAPSAAVRRSVPVRTFADWHDPPPGFFEAGPGGAQRSGGEWQLRTDTGADRHRHGLDRVRPVAGARAEIADRGAGGAAQAATLRPAWVRYGQ